jgi:hypothetical protein
MLSVLQLDIILLVAEYWYTPGNVPFTTNVLRYTLWIDLIPILRNESEIRNESLGVILMPFLVQLENVGGPPLLSPTRVKVGGSDRNELRKTRFVRMPKSAGIT